MPVAIALSIKGVFMTVTELQEGDRYFDLSDKDPEIAETLYQELKDFVSSPFLMPDGTFRVAVPHEEVAA
jgi:hypothetical protein